MAFNSNNGVESAVEGGDFLLYTAIELLAAFQIDAQIRPLVDPRNGRVLDGDEKSRFWTFAKEQIHGFFGVELNVPCDAVIVTQVYEAFEQVDAFWGQNETTHEINS